MGSVEFALFFHQGLDYDIILIEPVLMVSCCQAEYLVNHRLQRVPVVASSLVQLTFEGGSERLLYIWEFQLVSVKSSRSNNTSLTWRPPRTDCLRLSPNFFLNFSHGHETLIILLHPGQNHCNSLLLTT